MRIVTIGILCMLLCGACKKGYDHKGRTPIVELEGNFLYIEDLQAAQPHGLSLEDSVNFANRYIRNWIEDILLYNKAQSNIPDNDALNLLVKNYRKALVVHAYQQALIQQQLAEEISEEELMAYYDAHQSLFKLERPLMKGLFIKVPLEAPQLKNVRRWYKDDSQETIERLEKYSLQNAVKYEYFYDKWLPVSEVQSMLPLTNKNILGDLAKNRQVELKDTAFCYFLNVSDYREVGEQEPFEFARTQIKDILLNVKQADFMKQVRTDLYQQAKNDKKIKYKIEYQE